MAGSEAYFHAKFHFDASDHFATIHQRYRQDRANTDRRTGQRSDGIERTVLKTVAQKQNGRSIGIGSAILKKYWYQYCNPSLKFVLVLVLTIHFAGCIGIGIANIFKQYC